MGKRSSSLLVALCLSATLHTARANRVSIDENGVIEVDGKKTFVLSFATPPPPGGKIPDGKDGLLELHDAGATFARISPTPGGPATWSEDGFRRIDAWLDDAARAGIHCWITLGQDVTILKEGSKDVAKREALLRRIIARYKDHPGLGAWKGVDEPAWGKSPVDAVVRSYRLIRDLDPNHPVIVIHAPEHAHSAPLEPYVEASDVTGVDIYPISYPPAVHGDFPNKQISVVADATQWIVKASRGKPVWMTLQIAFGGTATRGKTLRFPTFAQQRYMAYAAIISGARGINYQGGALPLTLNERDAKLGWNWTFWQSVMRPLVEELGAKSPLHPALIAPDSKLPVKVSGADDVEFRLREVGDSIFILAARRESGTSKVTFSGLPPTEQTAPVLFESPRKVQIKDDGFEDWFGPNDVHVYRLTRK